MIDVYIFGHLKTKFDPNAKQSEITKLTLPYVENEAFLMFLKRLNLHLKDIGDCFLNHQIITERNIKIPMNARVAIFSTGMHLIDGGLYLKKYPQE